MLKNNSKGITQEGMKEQNKTNKQPQLVINKKWQTVIKLHAFMPVSSYIKSKTNGIKWPIKTKNQILLEMSATFILNICLQSSLHTLKCATTIHLIKSKRDTGSRHIIIQDEINRSNPNLKTRAILEKTKWRSPRDNT